MWDILEIIIIVFAGLGSAAFLIRYFFISSRTKKQCSCCKGNCDLNKEVFLQSLKDDKNPNRKV